MLTRKRTPLGLTSLLGLCFGVAPLGCASHPPPAAEAPAAPAKPPPAAPPDVTEVPVPPSLVFFMRISRPAASMKIMTDWAQLPALDPATLLESALNEATRTKDNAALAHAVDATQPLDVVGALDMSSGYTPNFAMAVAMKDLDTSRAALGNRFELSPGENGVVHLKLKVVASVSSEAKEPDPKKDPECELAPAAGPAPYRLVCATSHDALEVLAGYLARTLPRKTYDADLHIEGHAEPTKLVSAVGRVAAPKLLSGLLGMNSATEPATADLVSAVIGDFFDYVTDLDVVTMDAKLDPSQAALSMHTTFKSAVSLMARVQTSKAEQVDVPPSTLLKLPVDVDLVSFAGGLDPADLQHPRDMAIAAAAEQLEKAKLPTADTRALADLFRGMPLGAKGLLAHGVAPISDKPDPSGKPVETASYWLYEHDQAAAGTQKLARALAATLARPALAKWWTDHVTKTRKIPSARIAGAPAGLPAGSLDFELTTYPEMPAPPPKPEKGKASKTAKPVVEEKPTPPAPPHVYHMLIVPDGTRSWVAISTSVAVAKSKLAFVLGTHTPAETLASRAGLEGFRDMRMGSGGFFTVKGFLGFAQEAFAEEKHAPKLDWIRLLHALPAGGTSPILFTASPGGPTPDDPGGMRDAHITVPAAAIRDAIRFGLAVAAE